MPMYFAPNTTPEATWYKNRSLGISKTKNQKKNIGKCTMQQPITYNPRRKEAEKRINKA